MPCMFTLYDLVKKIFLNKISTQDPVPASAPTPTPVPAPTPAKVSASF